VEEKNGEAWTLPFSLSGCGQPEKAGNFESFCFPIQRWNQVVSSSLQTGRRRFARFLLLLRRKHQRAGRVSGSARESFAALTWRHPEST
jgi:hypothetical protein